MPGDDPHLDFRWLHLAGTQRPHRRGEAKGRVEHNLLLGAQILFGSTASEDVSSDQDCHRDTSGERAARNDEASGGNTKPDGRPDPVERRRRRGGPGQGRDRRAGACSAKGGDSTESPGHHARGDKFRGGDADDRSCCTVRFLENCAHNSRESLVECPKIIDISSCPAKAWTKMSRKSCSISYFLHSFACSGRYSNLCKLPS